MSPEAAAKIDRLHAQIEKIIAAEIAAYDKANPSANSLWRHVAHTKIDFYRHCPLHREQARTVAVAAFPRVGED
jgi:hypothetical protein